MDEPRDMGISLGLVGDLLWLDFPELRHDVYDMVRVSFERAIDYDSAVSRLSVMFLCQLLYDKCLRPAIDSEDLDQLRRGLVAAREMLSFRDGPPPWGLYGQGLYHGIIDHLSASDVQVMRRAHPAAVDALRIAFDLRTWL